MFPNLILFLLAEYSEYWAQNKCINKAKIIRLIQPKNKSYTYLRLLIPKDTFLAFPLYL